MLWDGSVAGNKYSSYSKQNLDVVNAIASLNNIGSRVVGNDVLFRGTSYQSLNSQEKRNKSQEVSCVSVKTGLILIRQNGKTFIVGNCPGEYLMGKMPYIAEEVNRRLDEANKPKEEEPIEEPKFKVGDKVKPLKLVNYNGTPLVQYDKAYTIMEINGDRVVLGAPRGSKGTLEIWAAMNINDIEKI